MKRRKRSWGLYEKLLDEANLYEAARKASRGKQNRPDVIAFHRDLSSNLLTLQTALRTQTYQAGPYRSFYIYEPKKRLISAAPYRDRVVHHALCNVMVPLFEPSFIFDSYANRLGKGTHKAILRYQQYCRRYRYVLKCDIAQFFPSISHAVLQKLIAHRIACPDTLWLVAHIIRAFNDTGRGLPIGNLTSQFWANVYMNPLDHFVKDRQGFPYVRYVDDFAIFSDRKGPLLALKAALALFLEDYQLSLHPVKTRLHQCKEGLPFLGHRVFPYFRLLKKDNLRRFIKRTKKNRKELEKGIINQLEFEERWRGWEAHARFSNTYRLRKAMREKYGLAEPTLVDIRNPD